MNNQELIRGEKFKDLAECLMWCAENKPFYDELDECRKCMGDYTQEDVEAYLKKLDQAEEENKALREAVEYAISQKEQDYGMESVYDIHQFRQRKVFSILEEALEKVRKK